jgi:DNA-directed RNA polymerase alpha subunit
MEVSTNRMGERLDKLEKEYIKLRKEIFEPSMKEVVKERTSSGFEVKEKKTDVNSTFTFIGQHPYIEINVEIGMTEDMDGIGLWVDMENEYFDWTEVMEKRISKRVTKEQFIKDIESAIDNAKFMLAAKTKQNSVKDLPVESLGIPARTVRILKKAGIHKLGQLLSHSKSDLYRLRDFGQKSLADLEDIVRSKGLSLKS